MKQPSGAETCSWEKKRCRNRTQAFFASHSPAFALLRRCMRRFKTGNKLKGLPDRQTSRGEAVRMWRGRAGRGCAAGSSGGAIRRQPNKVFNVNFPGPPECGCHVCRQRHSSGFASQILHSMLCCLRNSEKTQQVGFASIRVFRHADGFLGDRVVMRWRAWVASKPSVRLAPWRLAGQLQVS